MDRIIFNNDTIQESYSLNSCGIFGEDVEDWTMEQFYNEAVYMEALSEDSKIVQWLAKQGEREGSLVNKYFKRRAAKRDRAIARNIEMHQQAPVIAMAMDELSEWEAVPRFFKSLKTKIAIAQGVLIALEIIKLCAEEVMFSKKWGRFPADLKAFYEVIFELPEELSESDIKKLKTELKKLRKDTKWLTGRAGNEFITPKERKTVQLLDEQLKDLLTWRMIPKDLNGQKEHRVRDRIEQFVSTSRELLDSIHSDVTDTKTKNTMKDAIK